MKKTLSFAISNTILLLLLLLSVAAQDHPPQALPEQPTPVKGPTQSDPVQALPECSVAKTNRNCRLTIDRLYPVAPPTLQMYVGQSIVVVIRNPNPFERYFLDYTSGQATLKPDVVASIVQAQGLLTSLQSLGEFKGHAKALTEKFPVQTQASAEDCAAMAKIDTTSLQSGQVGNNVGQIAAKCARYLADASRNIYQDLEPLVFPDSIIPQGTIVPKCKQKNPIASTGSPIRDLANQVEDCITAFLESEYVFSAKIAEVSKFASDPAKFKPNQDDTVALSLVTAAQKSADAVAADLQGYQQRLADIDWNGTGFTPCANLISAKKKGPLNLNEAKCIAIQSKQDSASAYPQMVTRTITYSLDILNLVSNSQEAVPDASKKKALATITLNFADDPKSPDSLRWEASAGAWFSSLPVRSFSVAPVFTGNTITDQKITQNLLYPTVVPFAAANYRLTNDLGWTRWKSNFYATGGIGYNPNTKTADFATGLSLSWRALMLSALCHFGHDTKLSQGLSVGESLGAGFNGSVPTQTYWRANFALGVSIRVPSLTGR